MKKRYICRPGEPHTVGACEGQRDINAVNRGKRIWCDPHGSPVGAPLYYDDDGNLVNETDEAQAGSAPETEQEGEAAQEEDEQSFGAAELTPEVILQAIEQAGDPQESPQNFSTSGEVKMDVLRKILTNQFGIQPSVAKELTRKAVQNATQ